MSLGRPARRALPAAFAATLAAATAGCGMLPYTVQVLPRETAVKTRLEGEAKADDDRPAATRTRTRPALDDQSPLPPAIERPGSTGLAPIGPPAVDPAPPRDEAVTRAGKEQSAGDLALPEGVPAFKELDQLPAMTVTPAASEAVSPPSTTKPAPPPEAPTAGPPPISTTPLSEVPPLVLPPPSTPTAPEAPPLFVPASPSPTPTDPPRTTEPSQPPATAALSAVEPAKPEDVWRESVERLRLLARERTKDARPGSPDWAQRERLLGWLAEAENGSVHGGALMKGVVTVLDPGAAGPEKSAEIREAVDALESEVPLEVAVLKLCRKVNGFGDIETLEPATRRAGQPVVLYCEMIGLTYEPAAGQFRSRLAADLELIPPGTDTPAWSHSLGTVEDFCRRRRRDYYANYKFTLPENLPAGEYRLRIREKDLANERVATAETSLTIVR
jgi:hypothetical protein